mmetsp:Transcript_3069/g.2926  ORF Transcript_3069/g.2926 Transcript_3069/m.2926 type:complete len:89 (+) Transcript_3069:199-465(+)
MRRLRDYINSMRDTMENLSHKLSRQEMSTIEENLKDQEDWLEYNEDLNKEDYEQHLKDLQGVINPIISKIYKGGKIHDDGEEDVDGDL